MFLNGFNHRKTKEIIGSTYGDLIDYSMKVIRIVKGNGIDTQGGDSRVIQEVYVGENVQDDFGDVRFTDIGNIELSYFMENKINGVYADFVIKIPSIPSGSSVNIYIYYGNGSLNTTSNGKNTFVFYDDFKSYSLGSIHGKGEWNVRAISGDGFADIIEYNGIKYLGIQAHDAMTTCYQTQVIHAIPYSPNISYSMKVIYPSLEWTNYGTEGGIMGFCSYTISNRNRASESYQLYQLGDRNIVWKLVRWYANNAYVYSTGPDVGTDNIYYQYELSWFNNTLRGYKNNNLLNSFTDTMFPSFPYIDIAQYCSDNPFYIDFVYIKQYVEPEPRWGQTSLEETCESPICRFTMS